MEIVAGVLWIALGIFVIIKKGAVGLGGPPLVGTICAVLVFLGIFVCGKVILITESPVCFISSIFFCLFLFFLALGEKEKGKMPLIICGIFLAPLCLFAEILGAISKHQINPWSVPCYVAWGLFDLCYYSKVKESKKNSTDNIDTENERKEYYSDIETHPTRVWVNGRYVDTDPQGSQNDPEHREESES